MMSFPLDSRVAVEDGWEGSCAEHGREFDPGCSVCSLLTRVDRAQQAAVRATRREEEDRVTQIAMLRPNSPVGRSWEIPPRWQSALALAAGIAFIVVFR
jgi:hypothetical protein